MSHTCHWPGCKTAVPPKLWGCKRHWFALPADIRSEIWRTYRPGQEIDKNPSGAYLEAARRAQNWIAYLPLEEVTKLDRMREPETGTEEK